MEGAACWRPTSLPQSNLNETASWSRAGTQGSGRILWRWPFPCVLRASLCTAGVFHNSLQQCATSAHWLCSFNNIHLILSCVTIVLESDLSHR